MRELWHEIAYVEFTGNVTTVSHTEAAPLDVVSSGALTYVSYPIIVEFYAPLIDNINGLSLWDASTDLGRLKPSTAAGTQSSITVSKRLTPTAASHTYKVRTWFNGTTNGSVFAGAGGAGATMPGYIRVWQKGGA
jgi:hypothetical protein